MAALMVRAQNGEKRAYAVLLKEIERWCRHYFRRRVAPAQLDDMVQDVLMAVHGKRASWDPARPFMPWLAAIARYRWVDRMRKVYRTPEDQLEDWDAPEDSGEEAILARLSLARLLDTLSTKQRDAIELVKIGGLSIAEAAAKTGQSESAVKVNIHRGLKQVAAAVEKAG